MVGSQDTNADGDVRALLLGVAPEQSEEIGRLMRTTQFERAHDRPAMHLEASAFFDKGLVTLTDRTMQQVWLIAYLTWRTLHEQSGFVIVSRVFGLPYDIRGNEHDAFTQDVDRLTDALMRLREAGENAKVEDHPWPSDVPRLDPTLSNLRGVEDRAVYDLACFGCAFLLLHETHHAQKRLRNEAPGGLAEEMECDRFAISFLYDGCEQYARQHNHSLIEVARKRAMGLLIGLSVVIESTERGLWSPSESHPPVYDRIRQLLDFVGATFTDPDDPFWVFATCVMLSKLRRAGRIPTLIDFDNCRGLAVELLGLMNPSASAS
jgi:hypothetical protein